MYKSDETSFPNAWEPPFLARVVLFIIYLLSFLCLGCFSRQTGIIFGFRHLQGMPCGEAAMRDEW